VLSQARGDAQRAPHRVHLVLVNSSRASSSSRGVVVIERQVEVCRAVAGIWRLRHAPTLFDQNPRSMGSRAALGAVMPGVGVHRAVCDPLTWWPSGACDYCVVRTSTVVRTRRALRFAGAVPADDRA